jgi:hypothetical protein
LEPGEENSKRSIRYQRPTPPVPATYAYVRLPEEYTKTTNNQQFLQYNGQNAENRMLVFYSPDSLERLANAQTFGTGTQPGQRSGWVCLWRWLPGLSWHFWFLSTWCLYYWERDCVDAQELDFHSEA